MGKRTRKATKAGYQKVVKPLLFSQHPDDVHHRLIKTGRIVQKVPGVRRAPKLWAHKDSVLETTVWGIRFTNPVGLSAGFDKNIEMAPIIRDLGFGFMTGGSVTAQPCDGNPKPWFHRLPKTKSLVVHAGLPNQGIERVIRRLKKYPKKTFVEFPLAVSVAKTNSKEVVSIAEGIDDYCTSLRRLQSEGACAMYEINISCPNTYGGQPFTSPDRLHALLTMVDQLQLTKPVIIKMPISLSWDDTKALLDVITKHRVHGVAIGNLRHDRATAEIKDELSAFQKGNLSGAPTRDISTDLIRKTYRGYGDVLTIIGIGGIFTAEHAFEKIQAGASLVGLITGMIFEGPQVVGEINTGLERLVREHGYESIAEAVGTKA